MTRRTRAAARTGSGAIDHARHCGSPLATVFVDLDADPLG